MVLRYLPFEAGVIFRQVCNSFKERVWPNSFTAINLNQNFLMAQVQLVNRRRAAATDSATSYAIAPKLIQELTSIDTVSFTGLNLTKVFKCTTDGNNCLLQCLDVLSAKQHNRKISRLILTGITIDSIFDAETFCKKFVSRLTQIEELTISKCQPMFIDKFLLSISGA